MASVIAKKSSKVDPLIQKNDTEMTDLGLPPSTADLNKLLLDSGENSDTNNNSSLAAFTEETEADDSRRNSGSNSQGNDVDLNSSRSSTPRSNTPGGLKRIKRNTVVPIHEETSFGVDTKSYETGKIDSGRPPSVQAWSESSGSGADVRPGTAPTNVTPHQEGSKTSRPNTAPMSPRSLVRSNKVTPTSSPSSTPVKRLSVNSDRKPSGGKSLLDETISEDQDNTLSEPIYNAKEISKKKSNEAADFNKEDEKTDAPEKSLVELDARHVSVQSAEAVLAPPIASGDHSAYIPVEYAKEYIQRVIEDMKKMKANHYEVVEKIQQQYQLIEEESQAQFNAYVIKLRGEYTTKVSVFKQVIEAHQTEFTTKQKFYEEAIKSLREKNRQLLLQRKQFLLKAKDANTKHEEEKTEIITDLTGMLDQKHKEYISLHKKYSEEKSTKENFQTKNSELKSEIENLKMKLNFSSGEGQKIIEELTELRKENEDLSTRLKNTETEKDSIVEEKGKLDEQSNEKTNIIEEMKTKLNEQDSKIVELQSKVDTIEGKDKEMSDLQIKIEECEKQIKMLEERPVAPQPVVTMETQLNTDSNQQQSESSIEEVAILQAKVNTLEDKLKNFEATERQTNDSDLEAEINMLRNENNIAKMELLNVQEKNQLLHRRLETMLNEVMDTVNVDHISVKVNELSEQKITLENEVSKINEAIGDWKQQYQHEHNEQEPNENDRPDTVRDLFTQIKTKSENIKMLEKNITVLHMLLDGTLPDDMKQQENATVSEDSMLDELRKQHHEEVARLKNIIDGLKEKEVKTVEKIVEVPINSTNIIENDSSSVIINELTAALQETQSRIEEIERERNEELEAQKKAAHRLEKKLAKEQSGVVKLENEKRDLESQIRIGQESNEAEKKLQQETLDKVKKELEKLNAEKLAKFPVKAKAEIKTLQEKIKSLEASTDGNSKELLDLKTQNASLNEDVRNLKIQLEALQAKEAELQKLGETEKKYKELKKKYKALEAKKVVTKTITTPAGSTSSAGTGADPEEVKKLKNKISELETQLADGLSAPSSTSLSKKDSKIDPKAMLKLEKSNELLKEKVESMKKSAQTDADKIKELQDKLKESKTAGSDKNSKKKEKELKDLQKKFESEQKKTAKFKEDLDKTKEEIADAKKELDAAQGELKKNKEEITSLGVAAKEGLEAMEKVSELTKSNKELSEENKTLAENFNSERILRKKYYNMVEDMKGKIRVYARARPMSRSELDRGNYTIISSPDEYSLIVQTARGPKDFQYDAVFTPDHNQEKVFEDTNNLIQSAVDGYNVCIFAYGQTGSGKTFTMIGDKEQKFPGIAPRSFKAIYALIEENKTKFDFQTSMYMMELYRDNLIDLFGDHKDPAKLDIKKDKKGMVIVSGAVIKQATNSDELMSIFEKGSESRHVASTKMNSESSRSHLILSIIIESTNKTSGAVTKGKLSLVDLAGSERANKTGATAEQLKEAQSINKSLSALGDVISALSSEQSFIPYRNNKLTLLMQDSLGGNAKTLMFVNISPADYNCDETITSLTYASRVKLITNDASKNADNKEISRLKGIISKLKKGESVDEDVE